MTPDPIHGKMHAIPSVRPINSLLQRYIERQEAEMTKLKWTIAEMKECGDRMLGQLGDTSFDSDCRRDWEKLTEGL